MNENRKSVFDGLLKDNTVLSSLMLVSPVIICGDTLRNALALIYAFSAITFFTVMVSSFVSLKFPYTVRIICYAVIASLVYIPVRIAAQEFFSGVVERTGIYFPLIAVNSIIVFQIEAKFRSMKKIRMLSSLVFYILGFDAVMLITAVIRELLAYGTINNRVVDAEILVSGLGLPFGGFIFLGLFCGLYRKIRSAAVRNHDAGSEENVSGN